MAKPRYRKKPPSLPAATASDGAPPPWLCYACGRFTPDRPGRWWREARNPGPWRCCTCHPPDHMAPDAIETALGASERRPLPFHPIIPPGPLSGEERAALAAILRDMLAAASGSAERAALAEKLLRVAGEQTGDTAERAPQPEKAWWDD